MAEETEGSTERDYRGTEGVVEDATKSGETRSGLTRGRIGVSAAKSPKKWPAAGEREPKPGEGETAHGPPTETPAPQPKPDRPDVRPDPLKPKDD